MGARCVSPARSDPHIKDRVRIRVRFSVCACAESIGQPAHIGYSQRPLQLARSNCASCVRMRTAPFCAHVCGRSVREQSRYPLCLQTVLRRILIIFNLKLPVSILFREIFVIFFVFWLTMNLSLEHIFIFCFLIFSFFLAGETRMVWWRTFCDAEVEQPAKYLL